MTTYTAIADADIDPESPGNTTLFTRLRDNPNASFQVDSTSPYAAPTGFTGACFSYVDDDGDSQGSNFFDVDLAIGAAWESIGPTGSGATNIWTALDAVPSSSKYIIVRIRSAGTGATAGSGHDLYARRTGGVATTSGTDISSGIVPSNSGLYKSHTESIIPVDGSIRFDMLLSTGISPTIVMYLIGFGV